MRRDQDDAEAAPYPEVFDGPADIVTADGNRLRVWLRVAHDRYATGELQCRIINQSGADLRGTIHRWRPIELIALGPPARDVRLWGIHGSSESGESFSVSAWGYDLGCSREPLPAGMQVHVTVELTPANVLRPDKIVNMSHDGTISETHIAPGAIKWSRRIGWEAEVRVRHTWEKSSVAHNSALLRIERPCMHYSLRTSGAESARDIIDRIGEEAEDVAILLSLCGRRRVDWYEITLLVFEAETGVPFLPQIKRRRRAEVIEYLDRVDPLVEHRNLIEGGFAQLLKAFSTSDSKEILRRAISFVVGSQQPLAFANTYVLVHAAVEAIVNEVVESDPTWPKYRQRQWKHLLAAVREVVDRLVRDGLDMRLGCHVLEKATDLRRAPIKDMIMHTVVSAGVEVADLWPPGIAFPIGLGIALKLRNELVHRAKASDAQRLWENLVRLQTLAERLILAHLKWPKEKVWVWADQNLSMANASAQARVSQGGAL